jgi:hypothetical protein
MFPLRVRVGRSHIWTLGILVLLCAVATLRGSGAGTTCDVVYRAPLTRAPRAVRSPASAPSVPRTTTLCGPAGLSIWSIPLDFHSSWFLEGELLFYSTSPTPFRATLLQNSRPIAHLLPGRTVTAVTYYKSVHDEVRLVVRATSPYQITYR